jgi:hypothetical protein
LEPISGGTGGWCDPKCRRIVVDAGLPANAQVRVLVHELAHALGVGYAEFGRARAEVIVDTVTFVICRAFGLRVDGESVPYVAGWGEGGALDAVLALTETIDALADPDARPRSDYGQNPTRPGRADSRVVTCRQPTPGPRQRFAPRPPCNPAMRSVTELSTTSRRRLRLRGRHHGSRHRRVQLRTPARSGRAPATSSGAVSRTAPTPDGSVVQMRALESAVVFDALRGHLVTFELVGVLG